MERELTLDVAPEDLWDAVHRPDGLAAWLGEEVHFDDPALDDVRPGVAGRVLDDDAWRRLVVTERDDAPGATRLAFVWWPEDDAAAVTRVELVVVAAPGGSRLRVSETFACVTATGAFAARAQSRLAAALVRC